MFGILKNKILWIGLFLAFPPMAAWALRGNDESPAPRPVTASETDTADRVRMPVQVVSKDGKTEWVMVEVATDTIPEPGTSTLLMLFSCLCLLRRRREE